MGMSSLASTQALTPGAQLWVVGNPEESKWALKVDWALNFQIMRASRHLPAEKSAELEKIKEKSGLESPSTTASKNLLLVAADLNLPCQWVISLSDWKLEELAKTWKELRSPALRVFLPKTQSAEDFAKEWDRICGGDFQIVLD